MNQVSLVGRLTRDPKVFDSANGKIAKFNLATTYGYNAETKEERTEFVPITAFGISEALLPHLVKGRQISVNGRVGEDVLKKDGQNDVYITSVKVNNGSIRLIGSAPKQDEAADQPQA